MGKSTISMAIFNSFLLVYQRVYHGSMFFLMEFWRTIGSRSSLSWARHVVFFDKRHPRVSWKPKGTKGTKEADQKNTKFEVISTLAVLSLFLSENSPRYPRYLRCLGCLGWSLGYGVKLLKGQNQKLIRHDKPMKSDWNPVKFMNLNLSIRERHHWRHHHPIDPLGCAVTRHGGRWGEWQVGLNGSQRDSAGVVQQLSSCWVENI